MDDRDKKVWTIVAVIGLAILILGWWMWPASAQTPSQLPTCTPETTGLKYTQVEGSGLASMFFVIPLLAMAPLAGATDDTGQYRCHVAVVGADAAGAVKKIRNRPKVEPQ